MSEHNESIDCCMDENHEEPLVPCDSDNGAEEGPLFYDEDGSFTLAEAGLESEYRWREPPVAIHPNRPCSVKALNGSWLMQIKPTFPSIATQIRGPMRIELDDSRLRISGDIYVKSFRLGERIEHPETLRTIVRRPLIIRRNWYPAFPQKQYRWYFRSTGVKYFKGRLLFKFERHLWSTRDQDFVRADNGHVELHCRANLIHPIGFPRPTITMKGTAMIGGRTYTVKATKTSPYYRGCLVEVDVMTNRAWPATAASCDGSLNYSFTGVYRAHGMDFRAVVNEVNIPEDPQLTRAELQTLLSTHRSLSPRGNNWRLWILVGSRENGTFGVMFDQNAPHREGVVGYHDPTLPNLDIIEAGARNQQLGDVPLAFLRTLIHEAGHAFNLFHPKHDIHLGWSERGTTIMNQTGDVMGFATEDDPYPCNATMGFIDHNRTSLIHSPDPQVKPGWKEFGWGHGSAWSGVAEPVDAVGIAADAETADGLRLDLEMPASAHRGEFFTTVVTVTNTSDVDQTVPTGLNLAEDDLYLRLTAPDGMTREPRDVVLLCGQRHTRTLAPGKSFSRPLQVFYTNRGLTFDQPGQYTVSAQLDVGEKGVVTSNPVKVVMRPAVTDAECEIEQLMTEEDVAASFALGDFGAETATQEKLEQVADRFGDTESGAACAMVLANSLMQDFRDVRADRITRPADTAAAGRFLNVALKGRDASNAALLTSAVVSPREAATLMEEIEKKIDKARKGTYTKQDKERALTILSDHMG